MKTDTSRRGWFKIPGLQDGDRTIAQQLVGLAPMLACVAGRAVLDLGCAEGLIARECALAGAARVVGVEIVAEHVEVARRLCEGLPCEFHAADLSDLVYPGGVARFDVVLALAIAHKIRHPGEWLARVSDYALELLVVRMPGFAYGDPPTAFRSERYEREVVDVARILAGRSFALERVERGPNVDRGPEPVLYFRRLQEGGA